MLTSLAGQKASQVVVQIKSKKAQSLWIWGDYNWKWTLKNTQTLHKLSLGFNSPSTQAHTTSCLENGALQLLFFLAFFLGWHDLPASVDAGEAGRGADRLSQAEQPSSLPVVGQWAELHLLHQLPLLPSLLHCQDFQQIQTCLNWLHSLCTSQGNMGAASQG